MVVCAPVGIEDSRGVPAEQGNEIRELSLLVQGDDGEGTPAARLPVNGEVLGVGL